ncbi:MAG: inositol monophosphatase family protein [Proteobacteria bacterium]|nr:inositol monophosphatase family protein [Pseudomonadota bacterium]
MKEFLSFAETLADASRAIVREAVRKPFDLEIKSDGSPVTDVDKAVEDAIRRLISERFPDHGVLGEERQATAPDAEFKWIIDPIDGTLPFLAGIPVFGTLIALVRGEVPVLGVIDMPMTSERWIGCEGQSTTRNGDPVRSRSCDNLSRALMSTSNPNFYDDEDMPALERLNVITRWCVYGGSCMAYAQIASGRIDLGIDVNFDIYDYMALVPVIRGAGGVVTDWDGAKLTIHSGNRFVAAGDRRVHEQALEILKTE